MNFPIEQAGQNAVVFRVGASLDFRNASDFKAIVQQQVDTGIRRFILDFSETNVLDSTGLGSIFSLHRNLSSSNGHVMFAAASRPVQVVVQLTRTYKVFRQFSSVEAAVQSLE